MPGFVVVIEREAPRFAVEGRDVLEIPDQRRERQSQYPFTIRRLSKAEGGGWLVEFPDLPGCLADGDTIEEAVENGSDALRSWLATAKEFTDPVPAPSAGLSGKWVQRVPKSLHAKLAAKAGKEGVSLNTLVVSLIAEGLGRRATG